MPADIFNVEKQVYPIRASSIPQRVFTLDTVNVLRSVSLEQRQCAHPYPMCTLHSLVRFIRFSSFVNI